MDACAVPVLGYFCAPFLLMLLRLVEATQPHSSTEGGCVVATSRSVGERAGCGGGVDAGVETVLGYFCASLLLMLLRLVEATQPRSSTEGGCVVATSRSVGERAGCGKVEVAAWVEMAVDYLHASLLSMVLRLVEATQPRSSTEGGCVAATSRSVGERAGCGGGVDAGVETVLDCSHASLLSMVLRLVAATQPRSSLNALAKVFHYCSISALSQDSKPTQGLPPHNPGVRELVAYKRCFSSAPKRENAMLGFRGWHEAGRLPHRDEPGLTQFVTFRLADSFPESLRSEWEHLTKLEDCRERRTKLEAYLDKGRGTCHLRRLEIAAMVETALRLFHGARYELRAWVVMSNHVHVLFKVGDVPMSEILETWKKHTGGKANRRLKQHGAFWAAGYFDVYIRDAAHEQRTIRYIENNPTKAKLVLDPKVWPWTSARFRDAYGRLCL